MSLGQKISRAILQWPVSGLVNHKSLPENPITELKLDPARPIVYALKTSSITDLMTLQQCCEDLGLPGPFTPLELGGQLLPRYVCLDRPPPLFGTRNKPLPFLQEFHQLLDLHKQDPALDIQVVPVTLFWGRAPGREGEEASGWNIISSLAPNRLKKALIVILKGRENLVRFSPPLSLRQMADKHGTDEAIAHKLARVARTHFSRQQRAATGPKLPNRSLLFRQLLDSSVIQQAPLDVGFEKSISGIAHAAGHPGTDPPVLPRRRQPLLFPPLARIQRGAIREAHVEAEAVDPRFECAHRRAPVGRGCPARVAVVLQQFGQVARREHRLPERLVQDLERGRWRAGRGHEAGGRPLWRGRRCGIGGCRGNRGSGRIFCRAGRPVQPVRPCRR